MIRQASKKKQIKVEEIDGAIVRYGRCGLRWLELAVSSANRSIFLVFSRSSFELSRVDI